MNYLKVYASEFVGTALLLAIVAGSGMMGESLAGGNVAVALLGNSIATGAGLFVLITVLGPISGAHFNPVVSAMFWKLGHISKDRLFGYWLVQFSGAVVGIWLAHLMFNLPIIQTSEKMRTGWGLWSSEVIATMILLAVIRIGDQVAKDKVPMLVALTVTAGYWFTSSTFFSNPAVSVARGFTNTFVGISPMDIGAFFIAQVVAVIIFMVLFCRTMKKPNSGV